MYFCCICFDQQGLQGDAILFLSSAEQVSIKSRLQAMLFFDVPDEDAMNGARVQSLVSAFRKGFTNSINWGSYTTDTQHARADLVTVCMLRVCLVILAVLRSSVLLLAAWLFNVCMLLWSLCKHHLTGEYYCRLNDVSVKA